MSQAAYVTAAPAWHEPDAADDLDDGKPAAQLNTAGLSEAARRELEPVLAMLKQHYDQQMVAAVLSHPKTPRRLTQLAEVERAWLVAGLTHAGWPAREIEHRTSCSLRLVRSIRADPATQLCKLILESDQVATDLLRVERVEHAATRRRLAEVEAREQRLRVQLDQILDQLQAHGKVPTFPGCGHPKVPYNTYRHESSTWCRTCARDKKAQRRKARRAAP